MQTLIARARFRRWSYIRPGTRRNLYRQFKTFLAFCLYYRLQDFPVHIDHLCAYIEFLLLNFRSPSTVKSYISGVCTLYTWLGLDTAIFRSPELRQIWRGISLTCRHTPTPSYAIDVRDLRSLVAECGVLGVNAVCFKAFLTLLYFTMVRASSFLPSAGSDFDSSRHLLWEDIHFNSSGLNLSLKWAKNLQTLTTPFVLPIFNNIDLTICPVHSLKALAYLEGNTRPVFRVVTLGGTRCLLDLPTARNWLSQVVALTPLSSKFITLHSFRRGSCSAAFKSGAALTDLKLFGGWRSESVLAYLSALPARLRVADHLATLN